MHESAYAGFQVLFESFAQFLFQKANSEMRAVECEQLSCTSLQLFPLSKAKASEPRKKEHSANFELNYVSLLHFRGEFV